MKKHLPTILKTCVTLALLYVILRAIHPREIIARILEASTGWLVAAFLLSLVSPVLTAMKWHLLLRRAGVRAGVLPLLSITLTTGFIGTFLPSNLGVDALRMYALHRKKINVAANASSLLCDRLMGVMALVAFALAAFLPAWHTLADRSVLIQVAGLSLFIITAIVAFLNHACFEWGKALMDRAVNRLFPADSRFKMFRSINHLNMRTVRVLSEIHTTLHRQLSHPRTMVPVGLLTLLVQFLRIVQIHWLFLAIGTHIPWSQELMFVPIILLVSLLPISIFGLGIKEGAFVYLFSQVGVDPAVALAVSFYTYILQIMIIIPGSVIFLYERFQAKREQGQPPVTGAS